MKRLLVLAAWSLMAVTAGAQTATTFEMRYFTPDAAADGVTDFHGETEWFTTPQRVEMLGKYARYASRFWGDPGLDTPLFGESAVTEALSRITPAEGPDWMLLLIDADQDASTGWSGYDYVVNQVPGKLMAFGPEGWAPVADVDYAVSGNQLELSLPSECLGGKNSFDFKWADHVGPLEDPMFLEGDAAPNRRFNYRFIWKR